MSIYTKLASVQRRLIAITLLAWLAGFLSILSLPPRITLVILCASIAVMLGALVYFYQATRCQRCGKRLWLHVSKIVPLGPFKPRLDYCPSCKVSVHAEA